MPDKPNCRARIRGLTSGAPASSAWRTTCTWRDGTRRCLTGCATSGKAPGLHGNTRLPSQASTSPSCSLVGFEDAGSTSPSRVGCLCALRSATAAFVVYAVPSRRPAERDLCCGFNVMCFDLQRRWTCGTAAACPRRPPAAPSSNCWCASKLQLHPRLPGEDPSAFLGRNRQPWRARAALHCGAALKQVSQH